MNYLNLPEIREHLGTLKRLASPENNAAYFSKISFNNFEIELYAGLKALCEPMVTFSNVLHYKKIQVGVYEFIRSEEHAVSPGADDRFAGFDWVKYFTYASSKGKVKDSYMGDKIPIEEVFQLIRDIYKVSRLKIFF